LGRTIISQSSLYAMALDGDWYRRYLDEIRCPV